MNTTKKCVKIQTDTFRCESKNAVQENIHPEVIFFKI